MPTDLLSEVTGLSASKLGQATVTEGDVLVGKTFYSGDKTLKTGTMKDTQSLAATPMVLTHACMSLNQASLPSGDCNPNFITSSSWGNSFTYTFQRAGNYRVYARSSVSWLGSCTCNSSTGITFINDNGTGNGVTTSYDSTSYFPQGATISGSCQRSNYSDTRQATMVIRIYYQD